MSIFPNISVAEQESNGAAVTITHGGHATSAPAVIP